MKKSILTKIPIIKAKSEHIGLAKRIEDALCFVHASLAEVDEELTLILSIFDRNDLLANELTPSFRIFLNKEDYITQDIKENKWLTSSIENLMRFNFQAWDWMKKVISIDNETDEEIRDYVNCREGNVFKAIETFQDNMRKIRLKEKHEKLKTAIDKKMDLIPELPEDFHDWINGTVLLNSRYIYYERKKGNKPVAAFCTNCKTDVMVENPVHNDKGVCPNCNSHITYKSIGKSTKITDYEQLVILQKVDGGLVSRYFNVTREYENHYRNPETKVNEIVRFFYFGDKEEIYEWTNFKSTSEIRWTDTGSKYYFNKTFVYTKNLGEVIKDTPFKYSAIKEYSDEYEKFLPFEYFRVYKRYPFIEYLIKLKLFKLVDTVMYRGYSFQMDLKGKNIQEILKINKKNIPLLKELNGGEKTLKIIQNMEEYNQNISAEKINFIEVNFKESKAIFEMTKFATFNKILSYLLKQSKLMLLNLNDTYQLWEDYLSFCKELKYDLKNDFVLFPKNLKERHDETNEVLLEKRRVEKEKIESERRQKIIDMYPVLKETYSFECKGLMIIPPKNADDLIKEGQDLKHCVGSYTDKIADGTSIILFVRKKENPLKSYCTLDIRKGEICQCSGYDNEDYTELLDSFLKKFVSKKLNVKREVAAA